MKITDSRHFNVVSTLADFCCSFSQNKRNFIKLFYLVSQTEINLSTKKKNKSFFGFHLNFINKSGLFIEMESIKNQINRHAYHFQMNFINHKCHHHFLLAFVNCLVFFNDSMWFFMLRLLLSVINLIRRSKNP